MCDCCDPTWRQNSQAEDENGGSTSKVLHCLCSVFISLSSVLNHHHRPRTIKFTDAVQVLFLAVILKCMQRLLELMLGLLLILSECNFSELKNNSPVLLWSEMVQAACIWVIVCVSFRFFDLFEKYEGYKSGKLKLKKPKQLQVKTFSLSIFK